MAVRRKMNGFSRKHIILISCAALLALWTVNATLVYRTLPPPEMHREEVSPGALSPFNAALRDAMTDLDRFGYMPGRKRSLALVLCIIFPVILCLGCLCLLLPVGGRIRGEVVWARALFDPAQPSATPIETLLRVSANRITEHGPEGGRYPVLEPIAQARFGPWYIRADAFLALPFTVPYLPLDTPLTLTCEVSSDFPCDREQGEKVVAKGNPEILLLTSAQPAADNAEFKLSLFSR